MRRRSNIPTLIVAAVVLCTTAVAADATLLRFKPEAGASIPYTMTTDATIELAMGAMGAQEMTNNSLLDLHLDVVEVGDDGHVTVDFVYDRFRIEAQSFGQSMVFDSEEPGAAPGSEKMDEVFAKMTGQAVRITTDARGRIQQVSGLDAIFEDLAGMAGEDPKTAPIMEMLRGSFSDEAVRGLMQQALIIFPEKSVQVGDSWTETIDVTNPMVGGLDAAYTYRFAGLEERGGKPAVRLDFDVSLEHDGTTPLLDQMVEMFRAQGAEVDVSLDVRNATGEGSVWLEPGSGVPIDVEIDQQMELGIDIDMTMNGQPQAMNMQMKMDTRTSMKRSE